MRFGFPLFSGSRLPLLGVRFTRALSALAGPALLIGLASLVGSGGCSTRASTPTFAPDSTLVYASKIPNDVSATITFALKDSRIREEARRLEKERIRQEREKAKELARLEREAQRKAAEEKRLAEEKAKKAETKAKKSKSSKSKKKPAAAEGTALKKGASDSTQTADVSTGTKTAKKKSGKSKKSKSGTSSIGGESKAGGQAAGGNGESVKVLDRSPDSPARFASTLADTAAAPDSTRVEKEGPPPEERAFDLEDGARVQAKIALSNVRARGTGRCSSTWSGFNRARRRRSAR